MQLKFVILCSVQFLCTNYFGEFVKVFQLDYKPTKYFTQIVPTIANVP